MRAWIVFFVAAIAAYYAAVKLQRRKVPTWIREPIGAAVSPNPKTILVTGATGFIGRHWCRALIERGDRLIVLTRNAHRARDLFGPHAEIVTSLDQIGSSQRIDAIVNLAGAPIMGAPWTKRRRELLLSSRLNTTEAVVQLIERLERRPSVLVSMSAVGYYG
ncbi:MAG TPA: NAD-dependent epimerase/dehydratase family protein, partial [Steroidobacteraceae bacterium]